MRRDLDALRDGSFDVLVIGGGIYGACVARDAALRGLRVALVERGDFGSETSHNSLKILHGGIRYTQHLDVPRLLDSARERRFWLTAAPELTRPQQFVIPLYGHGIKGPEAFRGAALMYNVLSARIRRGQVPAARVLSRARVAELMPALDAPGMTGGGAWHDGLIRDANRLLLAVLEDASQAGACVANHAGVVDLLGPSDRVEGALVEDRLTGRSFEIRARITVNCAGAGAAGVAARASRHALSSASFAPMARAMNLVVDRPPPAEAGFGFVSRRKSDAVVDRGGRMFFMVPWMGRTMIGTAHLPYEGDPEAYRFSEDEVAAFLAEINEAAPSLDIGRGEVAYCYAGLTPADIDDAVGEVKRKKRGNVIDHRAADGIDGLVSVVGIKWTTSRLVAERIVNHIGGRLGCEGDGSAVMCPLAEATFREDPADDQALAERCRVAVADEMARRLDDVIFRRTRLGETGRVTGAALDAAAVAMGAALGWDDARRRAEIEAARALLARHRGTSAAQQSEPPKRVSAG